MELRILVAVKEDSMPNVTEQMKGSISTGY
jgi:hypothetical protein